MRARPFTLGALVGIGAYVAVEHAIETSREPLTSANSAAAGSVHPPKTANSQRRSRLEPSEHREETVEFVQGQSLTAEVRSASQAAPGANTSDAGADPATVTSVVPSESQLARANEPKDFAWSYQMEQSLQQFVATHPNATHFDFQSIDCRSTHCELRAVGFDSNTWPAWQQIAHDIKQQTWNEFDTTGTSSTGGAGAGGGTGQISVIMTLHRAPPRM